MRLVSILLFMSVIFSEEIALNTVPPAHRLDIIVTHHIVVPSGNDLPRTTDINTIPKVEVPFQITASGNHLTIGGNTVEIRNIRLIDQIMIECFNSANGERLYFGPSLIPGHKVLMVTTEGDPKFYVYFGRGL